LQVTYLLHGYISEGTERKFDHIKHDLQNLLNYSFIPKIGLFDHGF